MSKIKEIPEMTALYSQYMTSPDDSVASYTCWEALGPCNYKRYFYDMFFLP